jgi:hypothetical protein
LPAERLCAHRPFFPPSFIQPQLGFFSNHESKAFSTLGNPEDFSMSILKTLFSAFPCDDGAFFKQHNCDFRLRETSDGFVVIRRADGVKIAITPAEFIEALDAGIGTILNGKKWQKVGADWQMPGGAGAYIPLTIPGAEAA